MPLKTYKPTSPGRRGMSGSTFEEITTATPQKRLMHEKRGKSGRNFTGHVTVRHRGGGHKRQYRIIDFKRDKYDIPAHVTTIEYDPNRSARIALLVYADGEKRYIISPLGLQVGDTLINGPNAPLRDGNTLPLRNIPIGSVIHNIELQRGRGGQLARSAGVSAQLIGREEAYAQI